jgi:hypothetical protein
MGGSCRLYDRKHFKLSRKDFGGVLAKSVTALDRLTYFVIYLKMDYWNFRKLLLLPYVLDM